MAQDRTQDCSFRDPNLHSGSFSPPVWLGLGLGLALGWGKTPGAPPKSWSRDAIFKVLNSISVSKPQSLGLGLETFESRIQA